MLQPEPDSAKPNRYVLVAVLQAFWSSASAVALWELAPSRNVIEAWRAAALWRGTEEQAMTILKWALIFLVVSIIAGLLGFTGISAASADIARFLFYIFVVIFLVLLILGLTVFRA